MFELVRGSGNTETRMSIEAKAYPDPALGKSHKKNPDYDRLLREFLRLVDEFGFRNRVILQCFDWALLVRMKELDPGIRTIALYCEQPSWGTPDAVTLWLDRDRPSPWLGGIDIHDFDGDPVRAAHSLGIDDVSPYFKEILGASHIEPHRGNAHIQNPVRGLIISDIHFSRLKDHVYSDCSDFLNNDRFIRYGNCIHSRLIFKTLESLLVDDFVHAVCVLIYARRHDFYWLLLVRSVRNELNTADADDYVFCHNYLYSLLPEPVHLPRHKFMSILPDRC